MITNEEKIELENLYQKYLHDPKILKMKEIGMHRGSNSYIHSFKVCKLAIRRAIRKRKKVDLEAILIASILHDYYLYDWRLDHSLKNKHGRRHPFIAAKNAKRDFNISDFVSDIIESHMWPLNFKHFQKTKEARIVGNADNSIALREALTSRKYKNKRNEKTLKFIENLFN